MQLKVKAILKKSQDKTMVPRLPQTCLLLVLAQFSMLSNNNLRMIFHLTKETKREEEIPLIPDNTTVELRKKMLTKTYH